MVELILISLVSISLINYNPVYRNILDEYGLDRRPFNCEICLATWIGFFGFIFNISFIWFAIWLACPAMTVLINKIIKALPNTFN